MNASENALNTYLELMAELFEELDILRAQAEDHFGNSPEEIHWGHVGDLRRKLALIKQANGQVDAE